MQKTLLGLALLVVMALPGCGSCCDKKGSASKSDSPKATTVQTTEALHAIFEVDIDEIEEVDFDEIEEVDFEEEL